MSRWGGFLDDIDAFDAGFFGIAPREAMRMDPQQRLLLETAWEALEDAGIVPAGLAGSQTGVFVGQVAADYWELLCAADDLDIYSTTGSAARCVLAGRLSYALDLRGPSVAVDTACSSSLVALHMACQSLRAGESRLALVGGVNLILKPEPSITYSQASMLAADGRCKFGDARADGFVRSDGVGVVVLKPLADAMADGDPVRAVVLGSATGNDGQGSGYLMTPARSGQEDVLTHACEFAGLDPATVDYVEAHGTGTGVGDPAEVGAIAEVFGRGRPADRPLWVGSVKTNIGHCEGAAGMAGLIKAVLCLQHRALPPNLHLVTPNPRIGWDTLPLAMPSELTPLPDHGRPAVAGVSSFGISGTNAHVVLAEHAPEPADQPAPGLPGPAACLLPVSAKDPGALAELAARYAAQLREGARLADVCYSAGERRSHHECRLAVVGRSAGDVAGTLARFAAGEDSDAAGASIGYDALDPPPELVFVFPGQGSQWTGMGRELLARAPAFAAELRACDAAISAETGWSVLRKLSSGNIDREGLSVIQPVLWAMEVSLTALWRSWGVEPDYVVGHSMGEAAAAYAAGALSLADAAAVICRRSALAESLGGQGSMASVELSERDAQAAIAGYADRVAVAAANGPVSTVLSGDPEALAEIGARLAGRGVFCQRVTVDFASHSPQVDAILPELESRLGGIRPTAGHTPIFSTVLGELIDGNGLDAAYWVRNLREQVRFTQAVGQLAGEGDRIFVEVSPHPVLLDAVRDRIADAGSGLAVGSLRRHEPELESLLASLAQMYVAGRPVNWRALRGPGAAFVRPPMYPWRKDRYWINNDQPGESPQPARDRPHPLIGSVVRGDAASGQLEWENELDLPVNSYLSDHRVQGVPLVPGTASVEIAVAAARQAFGDRDIAVRDIVYRSALLLRAGVPQRLRVVLNRTTDDGTWRLELSSRVDAGDAWAVRTTARLDPRPGSGNAERLAADDIRARCTEHIDGARFYRRFAKSGNEWGASFQAIQQVWRRDGEALALLRVPAGIASTLAAHQFHPALLDACGQTVAATMPLDHAAEDVFVLGGIDTAWVHRRPGAQIFSHAVLVPGMAADSVTGDIRIFDESGDLIAELLGLRLQYLPEGREPARQPLSRSRRQRETEPMTLADDWRYELAWRHGETPAAVPLAVGPWLLLADRIGIAQALAERIRDTGQAVVLTVPGTGFGRVGADCYQVRPDHAEDFTRILDAGLAATGAARWAGVVHLWNLNAPPLELASDADMADAEVEGCRSIVRLVQAIDGLPSPTVSRMWLITRGAQHVGIADRLSPLQAPAWGLGRAIGHEHAELTCSLVDIDPAATDVEPLAAELAVADGENQVALRGTERFLARLARPTLASAGPVIRMKSPGSIDDLRAEPAAMPAPGRDEVTVRVTHAALNYRDVLQAIGLYPGQDLDAELELGWECAGTVAAVGEGVHGLAIGDEVVAVASPALRGYAVANAELVFGKPARLTAEEAAGIPIAFLTAYHALCHLGRLTAGERVLVHSATGGVGLAGIQIAQWKGARVFATAGSEDKRALLRVLGVRHTADSRSVRYAEEFRRATGGAGVDVVLNTLTGDAIGANLGLLAPYGRYLELTKRDIAENTPIGLGSFANNLSFAAIDVTDMIKHHPERAGAVLREVFRLIEQGVLRPLPYQVFRAADAVGAFRLMAASRHVGKVVLSFADLGADAIAPDRRAGRIHADASYLITGGLGDLGLLVAEWLASRGARHLLLVGRTVMPSPPSWGSLPPGPRADRVRRLEKLRDQGIQVTYESCDVTDADRLSDVIAAYEASGNPAVAGVMHTAGVVRFESIAAAEDASFADVLRPKTIGAWALHRIFGRRPLDFFVLFSSASSIIGSPLLGVYAAGNAFLDALAGYRVRDGLKCQCVNWGFWSSVGMAARQESRTGHSLRPAGVRAFSPDDGLAVLGRVLAENAAHTIVMPMDWDAWRAAYPAAAAAPMFAELLSGGPAPAQAARPAKTETPEEPEAPEAPASGSAVPGPPQPVAEPGITLDRGEVEVSVKNRVAQVLKLPIDRISSRKRLNALGLDSLMAAEVRNHLRRDFGTTIPMMTLLGDNKIDDVVTAVLEKRKENG